MTETKTRTETDRLLGVSLSRARRLYAVTIKAAARELDMPAKTLMAIELGQKPATDAIVEHYIKAYRIDANDLAKLRGLQSG